MHPLYQKTALITGSGRGIGAATARLFAQYGANVILTSRSLAELQAVQKEIQVRADEQNRTGGLSGDAQVGEAARRGKAAGKTHCIACDLGDEAAVNRLWEQSLRAFGTVDILVNNAAMIEVRSFIDTDPKLWDQVMALNLKAPYLLSRLMLIHYQATKKTTGGAIVNLSSLGGIQGTEKFPGFGSYSVSKFGIVGLTELLAVEGKEYKITASYVAPGATNTAMLKKAAPFLAPEAEPEDIAKQILDKVLLSWPK